MDEPVKRDCEDAANQRRQRPDAAADQERALFQMRFHQFGVGVNRDGKSDVDDHHWNPKEAGQNGQIRAGGVENRHQETSHGGADGFLAVRWSGECRASGTAWAGAVNSGDDAAFLRTFGQTPKNSVKGFAFFDPMNPGEIIDALRAELQEKHHCHTVILYGSRAIGAASAGSDYDLAGFAAVGTTRREARIWMSAFVDLFIYPESYLTEPVDVLKLLGGVVLTERDGLGTALLARLEEQFAAGPEKLPPDELEARRVWAGENAGASEAR